MRDRSNYIWKLIVLLSSLSSCSTPKYTYYFESGKHLDFSGGKWILNGTRTGSQKLDTKLYDVTEKGFCEILGDSLFGLNEIRKDKLIPPKISFDIEQDDLLELGELSGCDYLINVGGSVLRGNVGPITIPSEEPEYYHVNESTVVIRIYDLSTGIEISSSGVNAKLVDQGRLSKPRYTIPTINASAEMGLLNGTKKLIKRYYRYSANK